MKKIILLALFASATLFAADAASVYKSGFLLPPKGDVIYERQCASCHGLNGKQTRFKGSAKDIEYAPIAGRDLATLKHELREFKSGQADKDYIPVNKTGYGALMRSATIDLSIAELNAVAQHINGLK